MAEYIIMLIMIIVLGIIVQPNKTSTRKKIYIIVSFGSMAILAALRKYIIGIDLELLYAPAFENIAKMGWESLSLIEMETGYVYFCKLLTLISQDVQVLIIVTSIFIYSIYGWFIYKNSKNVIISTTMFIFLSLFFMSMNIVRQEIAVAIILIAYEFLKKNKKIVAISLIILATTIHASAIICLLIFILLYGKEFKKKYLIISVIVIMLLLVIYKPLLTGYSVIADKLNISNNKDYSTYLESETYGVGNVNLNTISTILFAILIYALGYYYITYLNKEEDKEQKKVQSFYLFMTMFYSIVSIVSIKMTIISRLSYYFIPFILLILPECLSISKNKYNKQLIVVLIYGVMMAKYFYIFFNLADVLFGVMPYKFFWE